MTEIIHHDVDSGANSALMVVLIVIVVALAGFFLWKLNQQPAPDDGTNIQIQLPDGNSGGGSSGGTTY